MNKIKELRKAFNHSQVELAQILNVHQTAVSQWEKERTFPDIDTLQKIAGYFGVSVDYLMGLEKTTMPIRFENIEIEYLDVIEEAKAKGFSVDDLRLAMNMLELARSR